MVGSGDETLEGHYLDLVRVYQVTLKTPGGKKASECPSFAAQNQVRFCKSTGQHCVGETDDLKRHLLLGRSRDLLPFQRDKDPLTILARNNIDNMPATADSYPNALLKSTLITTAP